MVAEALCSHLVAAATYAQVFCSRREYILGKQYLHSCLFGFVRRLRNFQIKQFHILFGFCLRGTFLRLCCTLFVVYAKLNRGVKACMPAEKFQPSNNFLFASFAPFAYPRTSNVYNNLFVELCSRFVFSLNFDTR